MATQLVLDNFVQASSSACIADLTPPTFSGISSLVANLNGSLTASWTAATDATTPIRYEVYIQADTATGLFVDSNVTNMTYASPHTIFLDAADVALEADRTYYVGVRAVDAVGNENTNTVSLSAVSQGVLTENLGTIASALQATEALLAADHVNFVADHANFQTDHTNFGTDHTNFGSDHTAFQGDHTNFQTDHTNFQTDHTNFQSDHTNLVTVYNDLAATAIDLAVEKSECRGVFAISNANMFTGELWFEHKGQAVDTLLGTASYSVYDSSDSLVAGLSETGITANGNGIFVITPVDASPLEPFVNYRVEITITYNSLPYTSYKGLTVGE